MQDLTPSEAILALLARRRPGATICPSEAARLISPDAWRPLMPEVREAAARLADAGRVEVMQKGVAVDGRTVRGAVRVRLI